MPESVAVNIRGRSYTIEAKVKIESTECSGVIFAHGPRFGGHSLFIGKDDEGAREAVLCVQLPRHEETGVCLLPRTRTRTQGEEYTFVVEFKKTKEAGEKGVPGGTYGESLGETKLSVTKNVNSAPSRKVR